MAEKSGTPSDAPESVYIQEPMKTRGVVGEKLWGPYKTHKGSDISAKYSGGPRGLGYTIVFHSLVNMHVQSHTFGGMKNAGNQMPKGCSNEPFNFR